MAEPRFCLTKENRSLRNRHMVKCYPGYKEKIDVIEEFWRKLKFYKKLAQKQGNLIEFLCENVDGEKKIEGKIDENWSAARVTYTKLVENRTFSFSEVPRPDSNRYLKTGDMKDDFSRQFSKEKKLVFTNLHENTVYIDHFC